MLDIVGGSFDVPKKKRCDSETQAVAGVLASTNTLYIKLANGTMICKKSAHTMDARCQSGYLDDAQKFPVVKAAIIQPHQAIGELGAFVQTIENHELNKDT